MKNTKVVNFFAGPGAGKSTLTSAVFARLKWLGVDCEIASEFAKDLVWEGRQETFKDELYLVAKQAHRLFRLNGKVDVIITDCPLLMNCYYASHDPYLNALVANKFAGYDNINFFVERKKAYNPNGRNQTEEEAKDIDKGVENVLINYGVKYITVPGTADAVNMIVDEIMKRLQ